MAATSNRWPIVGVYDKLHLRDYIYKAKAQWQRAAQCKSVLLYMKSSCTHTDRELIYGLSKQVHVVIHSRQIINLGTVGGGGN